MLYRLQAEGVAVERLGRHVAEIVVSQERQQRVLVDLAACRNGAVGVHRMSGLALHPVVDEGVARPGVERDQRAVTPDPGDVADAADVDDRHRPLGQPGGKRAMIDGRQRRTLAAGRRIGSAQVVDDVDADARSESRPVANLDRQHARNLIGDELGGAERFDHLQLVQDRLAMESDDIDGGRLQPAVAP